MNALGVRNACSDLKGIFSLVLKCFLLLKAWNGGKYKYRLQRVNTPKTWKVLITWSYYRINILGFWVLGLLSILPKGQFLIRSINMRPSLIILQSWGRSEKSHSRRSSLLQNTSPTLGMGQIPENGSERTFPCIFCPHWEQGPFLLWCLHLTFRV